jgi:sulfoxide reductase heme-binding subunit YedZ
MVRAVKILVFLAALSPALGTGIAFVTDALGWTHALGANPIDALTDTTGIWALRFVLATLAITPLRRLTGWNVLIRFRRMLGLFAFAYALLHFATWLVLDQFFAWDLILADLAKRPFITAGFTGFALMIPLAVTSTAGWIRRLGGRTWNRLHRLIYATGIAGVVHFLWLVKVVEAEQITYAVILSILLGLRVWWAVAKRLGAPARAGVPDRAVLPRGRVS